MNRPGRRMAAQPRPVERSTRARISARSPALSAGNPMPVAAIPHIGEEAGAVLMKMQERLALQVEDPRPLLDEGGSGAEHLKQIG